MEDTQQPHGHCQSAQTAMNLDPLTLVLLMTAVTYAAIQISKRIT